MTRQTKADQPPVSSISGVETCQVTGERVRFTRNDSGASVILGAKEAAVAQLFDGERRLDEVLDAARCSLGLGLSPQQLAAFQARLTLCGILRAHGQGSGYLDPYTRAPAGALRRALVIPILRLSGQSLLRIVGKYAPWAVSRTSLGVVVAFVACSGVAAALSPAAPLGTGALPTWLLVAMLLLLVAAQVFVHELGHALACGFYGVAVREMGLALSALLPTGWTLPDQLAYAALPLRPKIAILAAGPLGSLAWASAGWWLWRLAPHASFTSVCGAAMTWSVAGSIPTLLPWFQGDAHALLSELSGVPALRSRAFAFFAASLAGKTTNETHAKTLVAYLALCVVGWLATAWALTHLGFMILR